MPDPGAGEISSTLERNIEALARRRAEDKARTDRQTRVAEAITRFTGSMPFVYLHLVVYGGWIVLNLGVLPFVTPWDPTFVVLAMIASVEAIFLSTFVLISQNRMAAEADRRADLDLHINLLTEHELSRLAALLGAVAQRLDVDPERTPEFKEVEKNVDPEQVLDVLERREPEDQ